MTRAHYEYAVRYRRHGWGSRQARFYQSEDAAWRYVDKITTPSPEWAPLAELVIERREVGPWETGEVIR